MKDRLGNELKIGGLCVCYNNMRTGSSTSRLVQYEGEIIGFTPRFVKVKCVKCSYEYRIGQEFKCCPDNVFKINSVVRGDWEWFDEKHGTPIDGYDYYWGWRCSKCKKELSDEYDNPDIQPKINFCPNCGAKMDRE